jgi:Fe-S cluster assembly ATP-binding protein
MSDAAYKGSGGTVVFNGEDMTGASPDKRSLAGIFLSYQAPVEVPGVPLYSYLRTITQKRPELKMTARKFRARVGEIADQLDMGSSFLTRELNVGFSGGEKKKIEMLQLLLLQPKTAEHAPKVHKAEISHQFAANIIFYAQKFAHLR